MPRKRKNKRNSVRDINGVLDARLGLGPDAPDKSLTVLGLLAQVEAESSSGANLHYERALNNERYYHGFQNRSVRDSEDAAGLALDNNKAYRNYLRNMVQTWASRSQEDRPIIKAFPTHPSGGDYQASKLADAVLQDIHWREEMDQKLWDAAVYAQLHGKVGFKVCWNKFKGRDIIIPLVDEDTGEQVYDDDGAEIEENLGPQGEVDIKVCTIFEYDYGGGLSAHDADWCIFTEYIPEIRARGLIRSETGKGVEHVHTESYLSSMGQDLTGVRVVELWHRPGDLLPNGLYALIVGGHVCVAVDFPYEHGMLPICEWKINPIRNSRFATSHVDDAVQVQSLINDLEEAKVRTVEATGYPRLLALPNIAEAIEEGPHIIKVDGEQAVNQGARYLNPPDPSPLVFQHQGEATQGMYDIFGLNEVLVGKDSVKSGTSAKQIAYLAKLDSMKMSGPTRNLEVAMRRKARMELSLTRQYVEADRIARLAGPGGELQVMAFNGADLFGYDIHLEPNSGLEKYRSQEQAEAMEELQMGAASPREYMERKDTGLEETMSSSFDRQRASSMVSIVLQGGMPQPDPTINPQIALQVIARSLGMNPRFDRALQQLADFYKNKLAQAQQQQQGGAPSGGAVSPAARRAQVPNRLGKGHGAPKQEKPGFNPGGDPSK